jgi:hypothetical protein
MSRVELKKDKGTKPWTVEKIKNAVFDNKPSGLTGKDIYEDRADHRK